MTDAVLVPVVIIIGKLLTFVFSAIMTSRYGAGKISDAFLMAHSIPNMLFEGFATAVIACYVPLYNAQKKNGEAAIKKFNSNLTSITVLISVVVAVVYYIFQDKINRMYAKGFDQEGLTILREFTGIMIWTIVFVGAYSVMRAYLQVSGHKTVSSITQMVAYGTLIFGTWFFFPYYKSMGWATLAGGALNFLVLFCVAFRGGFRYRPYVSLRQDYVKTLFIMVVPVLLSILVSDIASLVDRYFASQFSPGIITSMSYGYSLGFSIQGIISSSMMVIVYPILAEKAADEDLAGMNDIVYMCCELLGWIVLPIIAGCIVLAKPVIAILFGHGKFSEESVAITALCFSLYLMAVFPMCLKNVADKACYALQKTKTAFVTTIVCVLSNVFLDIALVRFAGYIGLVVATTISIVCGMMCVFFMLKRYDQLLSVTQVLKSLCVPLLTSIIMGMAVYGIGMVMDRYFSPESLLLETTIKVCIGVAVYMTICFVFWRKHLIQLINTMLRIRK